MPDQTLSDPPLYERDFYAWTLAQADALRAAALADGRSNALDFTHLAEEVEDLGRSEWRTAYSLTARILEHLYLLAASQRTEPKGHWRKEIRAFRRDLINTLTPTLRARLEAALEGLHGDAAQASEDDLSTQEPDTAGVDRALRWSLAQILGERDDPLG